MQELPVIEGLARVDVVAVDKTHPQSPVAAAPRHPVLLGPQWGGAGFDSRDDWVLGAPDVLLPAGSPALREVDELGARGLQLLLARSDRPADAAGAP